MSHVIGVLGASGGLGATTLAATIATRAAAAGLTAAVVDTHPYAGGLDVVLGLEQEPGLRWDDLARVDGPVDGVDLRDRLPATGPDGPWCLSHSRLVADTHSRAGVGLPGPEAERHVLDALVQACDVVVIDLPRASSRRWEAWSDVCDLVALLTGDSLLALASAAAVAPLLRSLPGRSGIVLRHQASASSGRGLAHDVAERLGTPVLATLGDDREVMGALLRGQAPGVSGRGAVTAAADELLLTAIHPQGGTS